MLLLLLLSKDKKLCLVSVIFPCRRLSDIYLCITRGLHFAHCLSHEMKQFLGLQMSIFFVFSDCFCQSPIFETLPHIFLSNHKSTHAARL